MADARRTDSVNEAEDALAEYNETYLTCRDLMHSWRILGHFLAGGWGATKRLLRCERCGMERTDAFDGVAVRHNYDQPEGYRIEGVHLAKSDIRTEQLRRAHVFDSEEAMRKAIKRRASDSVASKSVGRRRSSTSAKPRRLKSA